MIRDNVKKTHLHRFDQQVYLTDWKKSAAKNVQNNYYYWMSNILFDNTNGIDKLLDIGCGTGYGIIQLLNDTCKQIISIEENIECVKEARKNIEKNGYSVKIINRIKNCTINEDGSHTYSFNDDFDISEDDVIIITSDIITDNNLYEALKSIKFSAISVWLIGTHRSRQLCTNLSGYKIDSNEEYRLIIQNMMYELADINLEVNGKLQIVDRMNAPDSDELLNELKEAHEDQASPTSLIIKKIDYRSFDAENTGIELAKNREGEIKNLSLVSVISGF